MLIRDMIKCCSSRADCIGELDACTALIVLVTLGEQISCGRIKIEREVLVSEKNVHIPYFSSTVRLI